MQEHESESSSRARSTTFPQVSSSDRVSCLCSCYSESACGEALRDDCFSVTVCGSPPRSTVTVLVMKKNGRLAEKRRKSEPMKGDAHCDAQLTEVGVAVGVAGVEAGAMEPFLVRRLSSRVMQLPPLAVRQAQQAYCDRKPEPDHAPPRPNSLPLRATPLIAITTAEASRCESE
ncbi:hypothetical protein AAFF_G00065850 [Aldrovandia affinis]|uniref:Uncharacterized protein n=1 Tax=Aldrovandia affinis TaxID=143900 RepID=A0AAD7T3Z8_9TELE|nr:hypothetical protein AAFF_G00065850 [Aldrovandia affinis]